MAFLPPDNFNIQGDRRYIMSVYGGSPFVFPCRFTGSNNTFSIDWLVAVQQDQQLTGALLARTEYRSSPTHHHIREFRTTEELPKLSETDVSKIVNMMVRADPRLGNLNPAKVYEQLGQVKAAYQKNNLGKQIFVDEPSILYSAYEYWSECQLPDGLIFHFAWPFSTNIDQQRNSVQHIWSVAVKKEGTEQYNLFLGKSAYPYDKSDDMIDPNAFTYQFLEYQTPKLPTQQHFDTIRAISREIFAASSDVRAVNGVIDGMSMGYVQWLIINSERNLLEQKTRK